MQCENPAAMPRRNGWWTRPRLGLWAGVLPELNIDDWMELDTVGCNTGLAMQKIKEAHPGELHLRRGIEEVVWRRVVPLRKLCSGAFNPCGQRAVCTNTIAGGNLSDHGVLAVTDHQMVIGASRATVYRSIKTRPTT